MSVIDMSMLEALKLMAERSQNAAGMALQALKALQVDSPVLQSRYQRVVETAFSDPTAVFGPVERKYILAHIETAENGPRDQMLRVLVTTQEKRDLQMLADEAGQDLSTFIRSAVGLE